MVKTFYRIPGAPSLALLADLHAQPYQAVIRSLEKHRPALICIAGDLCYGTYSADDNSPLISQQNILSFLERCAEIAPTFLSLGNHEQLLDAEDLDMLRRTGAIILDNEFTKRTVGQMPVVIGGLTSAYVLDYRKFRASFSNTQEQDIARYPVRPPRNRSFDLPPDISWLQGFAREAGYRILLSHHPEYEPLVPASVDLILSGHAHGGQWRLFRHGVYAPGQGFWPKHTKGIYNGRLVVSAGLANTTHVPRLFNPTEIVYINDGNE